MLATLRMTLSPLVKKLFPLLLSLAMVVGLSLTVRQLSRFATPPGGASRLAEALPEAPDVSSWPSVYIDRLKAAHSALADPARQQAALQDLAMLYHANGFLGEARACYEMLAEMQPRDARWPYLEALARADYGDQSIVVKKLRRAIELDPGYSPAYLKLGDAALASGDAELARAAYEKSLVDDPGDPAALVGIARAYFASGRMAEAKSSLERALAADAQCAPALELGVEVYLNFGDVAAATALEKRLSDAPPPAPRPDPRVAALDEYCYDAIRLESRAESALRRGDEDDARRLLERAVAVDPRAAEAFASLARLHARAGRLDEAARVAADGLEGSPESRELLVVLKELIR